MIRLTVACYIDDLDDARNLAVCLGWLNGYSPAEWWGTFSAKYLDAQGREWRVLSLEVAPEFLESAVISEPVSRPTEDTENSINMDAALRAQAKLSFWKPTDPIQPVPTADPSIVVAIAGISGPEALSQAGLTSPPIEL